MREAVLSVIDYYAFFCYPPSLDEIHKYFPIPAKRKEIEEIVKQLVMSGELKEKKIDSFRYALSSNSTFFQVYDQSKRITEEKLEVVKGFLKFCKLLPGIQLLGISGSASMNNAKENSDIDLFIITKEGRLWTTRFWIVIFAHVLGLRSVYNPARVCLNLFFDNSEVEIRRLKRNTYIAHEVLQLRPIINRNYTYENFIIKNRWVANFFPNVKLPYSIKRPKSNWYFLWGNILENLFKKIQLNIIKKRLSEEYITENQLWLIQNDFEKKITPYLQKIRNNTEK